MAKFRRTRHLLSYPNCSDSTLIVDLQTSAFLQIFNNRHFYNTNSVTIRLFVCTALNINNNINHLVVKEVSNMDPSGSVSFIVSPTIMFYQIICFIISIWTLIYCMFGKKTEKGLNKLFVVLFVLRLAFKDMKFLRS